MRSIILIAIAVVAIALVFIPLSPSSNVTIWTDNGPVHVEAEIADSQEERQLGLMNRESLGENNGMLFIFETEQALSFWMKNTLIPLDIIFINEEKEIVDIQTMIPCESDTCPLYNSKEPALYALEVNSGFSESRGVKVGDTIQISQ